MNRLQIVGGSYRLGIGAAIVALCFAIGLRDQTIDILIPGALWASVLVVAKELTAERWKVLPGAAACLIALLFPQSIYYLPVFVFVTFGIERMRRVVLMSMLAIIAHRVPGELLVIMATMSGLVLIVELLEERYHRYRIDYIEESDAHLRYERMLTEVEARHLKEVAQSSRESVLSERNRIARSLHDYIGHTVSSAIMQLEAYKAVHLDEAPARQKEQLQTVIDTLKSGMVDIRSSIHHLHDESFDLEASWSELAAKYPSLQVTVAAVDADGLSFEQKSELLRLTGECIANTVKHSDARHVRIVLARAKDWYALTVRDDGSTDPGVIRVGMGLRGMRAFAEMQGGYFDSGYDGGFYVHIRIRGRRDLHAERLRAAKRPPASVKQEAK